MPSGSLRSAQTWSQGHLRSLASDAYAAALNDSAESKLDIEEGGVSPWKGDKVGLHTVAFIVAPIWASIGPTIVAPFVAPLRSPSVAPIRAIIAGSIKACTMCLCDDHLHLAKAAAQVLTAVVLWVKAVRAICRITQRSCCSHMC